MDGETKFLEKFFEHLLVIKMFHFQTKSGFRHLKCDEHMTSFLTNLDKFFEVWQGEYHKVQATQIKVSFKTRTDEDFYSYLDQFADWLNNLDRFKMPTSVYIVRDEIVADVRKLQYLIHDFE